MSSTESSKSRAWYAKPPVATPLIIGVLATVIALVCVIAGVTLNHNVRQSFHAVPLDPARLSLEEGTSSTTNLLVPVDNGSFWVPLELSGPPLPVVSYWENDDTQAVSTSRHKSGWGVLLLCLGIALLIAASIALALAASLLYRARQQTRVAPSQTSTPLSQNTPPDPDVPSGQSNPPSQAGRPGL